MKKNLQTLVKSHTCVEFPKSNGEIVFIVKENIINFVKNIKKKNKKYFLNPIVFKVLLAYDDDMDDNVNNFVYLGAFLCAVLHFHLKELMMMMMAFAVLSRFQLYCKINDLFFWQANIVTAADDDGIAWDGNGGNQF